MTPLISSTHQKGGSSSPAGHHATRSQDDTPHRQNSGREKRAGDSPPPTLTPTKIPSYQAPLLQESISTTTSLSETLPSQSVAVEEEEASFDSVPTLTSPTPHERIEFAPLAVMTHEVALENSNGAEPIRENASTTFIATIAVLFSVAGGLLIAFFVYKLFRRKRRPIHLRSHSSDSVTSNLPPRHGASEKCLGSTKLGSISRAVRNPFRSSRGTFVNRPHGSVHGKSDKSEWSKKEMGNQGKLGLSEVELSKILSSSKDPLSYGNSVDTQTTLPTDSWDQYMSILKHEEHLHFEDITPVQSVPSHPTLPTEFSSRHRHHPSLLSHYFFSTMGSINKVEPYNPNPVKKTQEFEMVSPPAKYYPQRHHRGDSADSIQHLLTESTMTATAAATPNIMTSPLSPPPLSRSDSLDYTTITAPSSVKLHHPWKSPPPHDLRLSAVLESSTTSREPSLDGMPSLLSRRRSSTSELQKITLVKPILLQAPPSPL